MDMNYDYRKIKDHTNVMITDEHGVALFYDTPDLGVLKVLNLNPNEIIGHKITSLYANIDEETSTIMTVLKTGIPIIHNTQSLISKKGKQLRSYNSTYPIMEKGKIIGAVEFSTYVYTKENSSMLEQYSKHKIFRKNNTRYTIEDLVTVNPSMLEIKAKIAKLANTNTSVLIYGKTGTGKEVVAQSIHNLSQRYSEPFISVNCGAIPSTLLESLLFGTEKGSFTGSVDAKGIFEQADGGTLFLDEINSLDYHLQVKILKAIEEKAVKRIGGSKTIPLDIRIISATNESPDKIVAEKKLRDDLYYRLGVVQLNLPDLIERKEDIPSLLEFYVSHFNSTMNMRIEGVHPEVLAYFYRYRWPGNIRELRNAIEAAFNNASGSQINLKDIPEKIRGYVPAVSFSPSEHMAKSLKGTMEEYEQRILQEELLISGYRIAETARKLGLSKQLLKYKMEKYHLR
ncbi:AAA domain-containing protein [Aminipila butyrica]|uniref:AAA domain-containing protein n=1 Tax=Aminipila butyrica TaxID=433296 RepID=A0A858BWG6_9FIRM|nr:sigma 54-interacting transcriptional regulator [Aminipila butyrica]QIB69074.1 AAA domain-containing protein [Aminipila butyrica]